MSRLVLVAILILLVPLHVYSASLRTLHPLGNGVEHLIEHAKGLAHHHHDGGSIDYDDSVESSQHLSEQAHCSAMTFIVSHLQLPTVAHLTDVVDSRPPPAPVQAVPGSLFRPPRA